MFQKGDLIVYGNMGVCRVEAVEAPAGLPGAGEKKLYYKLDPVYETGTVYIPVDAKVFMRPILTHAQPFLRRASDVAFQQNGAGLYFFTGCSFVTARQQADMVS